MTFYSIDSSSNIFNRELITMVDFKYNITNFLKRLFSFQKQEILSTQLENKSIKTSMGRYNTFLGYVCIPKVGKYGLPFNIIKPFHLKSSSKCEYTVPNAKKISSLNKQKISNKSFIYLTISTFLCCICYELIIFSCCVGKMFTPRTIMRKNIVAMHNV